MSMIFVSYHDLNTLGFLSYVSIETIMSIHILESSSLPESASSLPRYSSPITSDSEKDVGNKIESGDPGEWQLTVDDKKNEDIKKGFYFEQVIL